MSIVSIDGRVKLAYLPSTSKISYFGIFCQNGSIFENDNEHGTSHFAEHMFFKGTNKRSAKDITRDFAKIGASSNAYTSEDEVCYHVTVMEDHFPKAAEIMCDIFFNSTYPKEEVEKERQVILVERAMYMDDPSYPFSLKYMEMFSKPFSHEILGTIDSINSVTRESLVGYLTRTLGSQNIMFVYSGSLPEETVVGVLRDMIPSEHMYLSDNPKNVIADDLWLASFSAPGKIKVPYISDKAEQAQVVGKMPSLGTRDKMKSAETVLMQAFGGGDYAMMYGRLREDLSLCYSVGTSSRTVQYPSHNARYFYGSMNASNVPLFIDETEKLMNSVVKDGINQELVDCSKTALISGILRASETSQGVSALLSQAHFDGRALTVDEMVNKIKAVTVDDCNAVSHMLDPKNIKWCAMVPNEESIKDLI